EYNDPAWNSHRGGRPHWRGFGGNGGCSRWSGGRRQSRASHQARGSNIRLQRNGTGAMKIPLLDLYAQYLTIKSDVDAAVQRTIVQSAFVGGEEVRAFEAEFASYCEVNAAVGVGNGTDALYLALRALGIGSGDEVITVAHTFIATAEAISLTGARPIFIDI